MRLEFGIELNQIEVPRFSVEAAEGSGKLFTLATLVLNVLDAKEKVEIIFHGLNPEDPDRKIEGFQEIVTQLRDRSHRWASTKGAAARCRAPRATSSGSVSCLAIVTPSSQPSPRQRCRRSRLRRAIATRAAPAPISKGSRAA